MRKMREHSEELDWAASWFRFFMRVSLFFAALVVVVIVVAVLSGRPSFSGANRAVYGQGDAIVSAITLIVGLLMSAFLWRVGYVICSFLADFARGLLAQQIRREHNQNKS